MNLFKMLAIYREAAVIVDSLEEAQMKKKQFFKSKTFWFQILSGAAALSGVVPLSPEHVAIITAIINIGLRLVTNQPVSIDVRSAKSGDGPD